MANKMKINHKDRLMTRFPFGKHKGVYFKDIPDTYLDWVARTLVTPEYRAIHIMVVEEIEYRHFNNKKG
jgi:uncharacterized protein (DUF3820 family)